MARSCQQFAMFVLAHLFSTFFNDAAQTITSFQGNWRYALKPEQVGRAAPET